MKKYFTLIKLGIKYFWRYRRRYGFLLAALIFCFAIITFISSIKDGMYESVYYSAQSHYAGDIVAVGYNSSGSRRYLGNNEITAIMKSADASGIEPTNTIMRTFGYSSVIYCYGNGIELKYLLGCDWDKEDFLFNKMNFTFGPEKNLGDDGIIISVPTAKLLNAEMNDLVIVETETRRGQKNTGKYIIKGIVEDSSIFGYYKAYVSRSSLNRQMLYSEDDCSIIGFFLTDPSTADKKREAMYNALSGKIQTADLIYNREDLDRENNKSWNGIRVFLLTLPVYLSEISDLLGAMNILSYLLYGMMLLIILVSAITTYRMILHERTKELGVMRVIGFYSSDLGLVLRTEIAALAVISLIFGFLFAWIMTKFIAILSFSWFPGFEIFMKNGKLSAIFLQKTMLLNIFSIVLILFAASYATVFRASRKSLPGLLSGEPL